MKLLIAAALPVAALAACSGGESNNNTMGSEAGATGQEVPAGELPTTELNMGSDPNAVGPADNQVDRQSALGDAAGEAGNTVTNTVE